jgi:phage terminase small subunit
MPGKTKTATSKKTSKKIPAKSLVKKPKKPAEKPKKTLEKNDNEVIDFCGVKLTALRRDFLINYILPGQPCFHNALRAALKAGYKETVAKTEIYNILKEPDIQKIIKKNESIAHQALHASAMRALELKQRRAFFDPADYFEGKEITAETKDGSEYKKEIIALKPLKEMTLEQRLCIDGVDVKGQASIPIYIMADRGKELNDIIRIDRELSGNAAADGYDIEETKEIIVERVTIRQQRRVVEAKETAEYEIIESSKADIEEEL